MAQSWPSEVPLATLLVYSPRGSSDVSRRSRDVCYGLKQGNVGVLERAMVVLQAQVTSGTFRDFFQGEVGLVPAPQSAPLVKGGLWVPNLIAERLVVGGFGKSVHPYLVRRVALPKSAYAGPGERPTCQQHYDSIGVSAGLVAPSRLIVVDDVVTKGRTLLACVRRLREALPACEIACFAMIRTKGVQPEVENVLDPCLGRIGWSGSDVQREP